MFKGVAVKSLSSVEVDRLQSNQHEFHGVTELKKIFGYDRQCFEGEFYYVEKSGKIIKDRNIGELTWYDAREYSIDRSEYRLYYTNNLAVNRANAGDVLLVALSDDNVVKVIVIERGTQFVDVIRNALGIDRIKEKYYFIEDLELMEGVFKLFR